MPLRGDEEYVEIDATLTGRTGKAIRIKNEFAEGWVPRSCVHYSTDTAVDRMDIGDDGLFKVMRWVAEERGLI